MKHQEYKQKMTYRRNKQQVLDRLDELLLKIRAGSKDAKLYSDPVPNVMLQAVCDYHGLYMDAIKCIYLGEDYTDLSGRVYRRRKGKYFSEYLQALWLINGITRGVDRGDIPITDREDFVKEPDTVGRVFGGMQHGSWSANRPSMDDIPRKDVDEQDVKRVVWSPGIEPDWQGDKLIGISVVPMANKHLYTHLSYDSAKDHASDATAYAVVGHGGKEKLWVNEANFIDYNRCSAELKRATEISDDLMQALDKYKTKIDLFQQSLSNNLSKIMAQQKERKVNRYWSRVFAALIISNIIIWSQIL